MRLLLLTLALFCSGSAFADDLVECSSINYQPNQCRIRGWNSYVSIERVLSRATRDGGSCASHEWSFDSNYIYVNSGCRAIFRVSNGRGGGGGGGGRGQVVDCSSINYGYTECPVRGRNWRVTLLEQYSRSNRRGGQCINGQTYGLNDRGNLWVSGGCRGRFEVR